MSCNSDVNADSNQTIQTNSPCFWISSLLSDKCTTVHAGEAILCQADWCEAAAYASCNSPNPSSRAPTRCSRVPSVAPLSAQGLHRSMPIYILQDNEYDYMIRSLVAILFFSSSNFHHLSCLTWVFTAPSSEVILPQFWSNLEKPPVSAQ